MKLMSILKNIFLGKTHPVRDETSEARIQWVAEHLLALPSGWRLLDAGAGQQYFKQFCRHLEYVAQDFGQYDGMGDGTGIQPGKWDQTKLDLVCDITAIPVTDGSFDAVLFSEVMEHLPYPDQALRELARVLRPGGQLILSAPFSSLTHQAPYHFASGFNHYYFEKVLPELGLAITEMKFYGNFFICLAQELQRFPSVYNMYSGRSLSLLHHSIAEILVKKMVETSHSDKRSQELQYHTTLLVAEKQSPVIH